MKSLYKSLLITSFVLSGCTTTPEQCDPSISDPSFLDKFGCVVSGSYEKRASAKSKELKDLTAEQKALSESVIQMEKERSKIIADRSSRIREMDRLDEDLSRLESSLNKKNAMTRELQNKINKVRASGSEVKNLDESASIIEKKEKIVRLEKHYDELIDEMAAGIR